jgi:ubiquinone biosynthesis protein UbiJ
MLMTALEEIIDRLLRLDPDTSARLGEMAGKVIRLRLLLDGAAPLEVFVLPSEAGVRLRVEHPGEADVTIGGTPGVFARAFFGEVRPSTAASLEIRGDVELGRRFERVLKGLDIDWEEQASRLFGDVIAHRLGNLARAVRAQAATTVRTLERDVVEYLQEETRLLPRRERVEAFLQAVDRLRADADRLEKRLERLRGALPQ